MYNQPKTKALSFPQAISKTQSLIDKINANQLNEVEIQQSASSILSSKNGGRGFFVSYLTSKLPLVDNPSVGIINALKASIETSCELLVKNLAMSSAMEITHRRNHDTNNAEASQKVFQRTNNLIQKVDSNLIQEELRKLHTAINGGGGEYQEFLERWGYDTEQRRAIQSAISNALKY